MYFQLVLQVLTPVMSHQTVSHRLDARTVLLLQTRLAHASSGLMVIFFFLKLIYLCTSLFDLNVCFLCVLIFFLPGFGIVLVILVLWM